MTTSETDSHPLCLVWRCAAVVMMVLVCRHAPADDNDVPLGLSPRLGLSRVQGSPDGGQSPEAGTVPIDNDVTEPTAPAVQQHHYSGQTVEQIRNAEDEDQGGRGDDRDDPPGVPGTEAVIRMIIWVGVVIALIYGGVYLIRRYVPSARNMFGSGVLKVVGRTYISSKQCILLVKVGPKYVMVGVTGTAMSPLAEVSAPEDARRISEELAAQDGQSIADSFRKALHRADDDYAADEREGVLAVETEREVRDIREELDEVTQKMNWWRKGAGN